jgi:hypothetical protein
MIRADSTLAAARYRSDCPQCMLRKLKRPQNGAPNTAAVGCNFQIERSSGDHHPATKVTRAVVLRGRRWFEF